MPNHVQNKLTLSGDKNLIEKAYKTISSVEDGKKIPMDFNKIIPMPEELNIWVHSGIEACVKNALMMPSHNNELISMLENSNRIKLTKTPLDLKEEEWPLFIQCLQNVRKHGHMYWYPWSIEHWGTKWNAYDQPNDRNTEDVIYFQTAWSAPVKIITKLSEMFPELTVQLDYADEDTGSNCGRLIFKNGELINEFRPDSGSNEAYEIAFELRPHYKEDYELVDGKYKYKEEE